MSAKLEKISIKEWEEKHHGSYYPVIVPESIILNYYNSGFITDKQHEALKEGYIVFIAGWWVVLSKKLETHS